MGRLIAPGRCPWAYSAGERTSIAAVAPMRYCLSVCKGSAVTRVRYDRTAGGNNVTGHAASETQKRCACASGRPLDDHLASTEIREMLIKNFEHIATVEGMRTLERLFL